ncbi:netrin-4 [Platysternon megacephalum]|uniref:Netrin-4 n=1 Tax=Platysternon megacephalum TaxID=55544 RepID=A0A4D9E605_9SAUR|nr:netrin-4 [Platysternon megacephalum]
MASSGQRVGLGCEFHHASLPDETGTACLVGDYSHNKGDGHDLGPDSVQCSFCLKLLLPILPLFLPPREGVIKKKTLKGIWHSFFTHKDSFLTFYSLITSQANLMLLLAETEMFAF